MQMLVIGCGYLGRRVADVWRSTGQRVAVLTRSTERAAALAQAGFEPIVGDVTRPDSLSGLPAADVVLYSVGFDPQAGYARRAVTVDGLGHVVRRLASRTRHFIYISSTSVYGQTAGDWVDEATICDPPGENGRLGLAAESVVLAAFARAAGGAQAADARATVLRLSGLYGPGRLLAKADQLRRAQPLPGRAAAWLNLIHVDDAARAVVTVADRAASEPRYLVSDDRPVQRGEYYRLLAKLVGAPEPQFTEDDAPGARTPGLNKRCRNTRLRQALGLSLQYPTIAEGLPQAVGALADH